ncbi:hypothetical protein Vadar_025154 [Vaccinium darrowii]|uniref:Uncharacterized protein n=1 Tax=Vaccinium darrowii TaxID=229202 RepID=A0ACB7XC55_9ERIC|nr:hypothetical protein Vadar_025154 [Vaccinium darrowii]
MFGIFGAFGLSTGIIAHPIEARPVAMFTARTTVIIAAHQIHTLTITTRLRELALMPTNPAVQTVRLRIDAFPPATVLLVRALVPARTAVGFIGLDIETMPFAALIPVITLIPTLPAVMLVLHEAHALVPAAVLFRATRQVTNMRVLVTTVARPPTIRGGCCKKRASYC